MKLSQMSIKGKIFQLEKSAIKEIAIAVKMAASSLVKEHFLIPKTKYSKNLPLGNLRSLLWV
ncbi:MAG: hypothetical protein LBC76_09855 [Treponema sp.]|jgi:hypothetical protein|nr:hypothetical protein [Treponema sp.]